MMAEARGTGRLPDRGIQFAGSTSLCANKHLGLVLGRGDNLRFWDSLEGANQIQSLFWGLAMDCDALPWMARSRGRWRDLPERLGDYRLVKRRYYRWPVRPILNG